MQSDVIFFGYQILGGYAVFISNTTFDNISEGCQEYLLSIVVLSLE